MPAGNFPLVNTSPYLPVTYSNFTSDVFTAHHQSHEKDTKEKKSDSTQIYVLHKLKH